MVFQYVTFFDDLVLTIIILLLCILILQILLIDLILHKTKAYRHLFFNMPHLNKYELQV
jgi:hypothetical protein